MDQQKREHTVARLMDMIEREAPRPKRFAKFISESVAKMSGSDLDLALAFYEPEADGVVIKIEDAAQVVWSDRRPEPIIIRL